MPVCGSPGSCNGTSVRIIGWASAVPIEAPLAQWNDGCDLRTSRFPRETRSPCAGSSRPPGEIPRHSGSSGCLARLIIPTASNKAESTPIEGNCVISSECVDAAVVKGPQRESAKPRSRNYSWGQLMKRVFAIDVLQCDRCGGVMRLMAAIHSPEATRKILDCLGLPSRPPPMAPAVREPALHFDQF